MRVSNRGLAAGVLAAAISGATASPTRACVFVAPVDASAQLLPVQWTEQCRLVRRGDRVERKCQPMWIGPDRTERHNRRRSDEGGGAEHGDDRGAFGAADRGADAGARETAGPGADRADPAHGDGPVRDAPPRGDPPPRDHLRR